LLDYDAFGNAKAAAEADLDDNSFIDWNFDVRG